MYKLPVQAGCCKCVQVVCVQFLESICNGTCTVWVFTVDFSQAAWHSTKQAVQCKSRSFECFDLGHLDPLFCCHMFFYCMHAVWSSWKGWSSFWDLIRGTRAFPRKNGALKHVLKSYTKTALWIYKNVAVEAKVEVMEGESNALRESILSCECIENMQKNAFFNQRCSWKLWLKLLQLL